MLTGYATPAPSRQTQGQNLSLSGTLSRLLAAAVVSQSFRDLLLTDPDQALAQGFQGEEFLLDYYEQELVRSIQADSLSDFALQLVSRREDKPQMCGGMWVPVNQQTLVLHSE